MDIAAYALLESLFRSAVAAAHPAAVLPPNLPEPPPRGRLVILAAGKSAGAGAAPRWGGRHNRSPRIPMEPTAAASAPRPGRGVRGRQHAARARAAGLDPAAFLADNDSTGFFNAIGDLFSTGPTFTTVTDFRAIVVVSPGIRSRTVNRT